MTNISDEDIELIDDIITYIPRERIREIIEAEKIMDKLNGTIRPTGMISASIDILSGMVNSQQADIYTLKEDIKMLTGLVNNIYTPVPQVLPPDLHTIKSKYGIY